MVRRGCVASAASGRIYRQRQYDGGDLTGQVQHREVTTAVARGTSKKITVDVKGEIMALKSTINTMVDQLNSSLASEVTRGQGVGSRASSADKRRSRASAALGDWLRT